MNAKQGFKSTLSVFLVALWATSFFAGATHADPIQVQVDQAVPHGRFKIGVGSRLTLRFPKESHNVPGVFLGRLVEPNGTFSKFMVLDESRSHVYMTNRDQMILPDNQEQPVLRQYDQIGGTCTGYALDHLLQQLYWSGFVGNGALRTQIANEKGRTQLLVDTINEYYLVMQHRYSIDGILKKYGTRFGFNCEKKIFTDAAAASQYLVLRMNAGLPVLIAFNIGPTMMKSEYVISDYENPEPMKDPRLWVPRKIGERNSGGHSVIAVAAFASQGHADLLMLDSDWAEPRIWNLKQVLTDRTAMSEIEFYSCR